MIKKWIKILFWTLLRKTNYGKMIIETQNNQTPVTVGILIFQKLLRINAQAYWPMSYKSTVVAAHNIYVGIDSSPGYSPGCYIQGGGKLYIGNYTQIGPNVGLISSNHSIYNNSEKVSKITFIGDYCWIGMGAIVLPGVELGDFTIVAAGSVVTKSFKEGYCVIGGNPAKMIKILDRDLCVRYQVEHKYNGYVRSEEFESFKASFFKN
jgi:acetyltransferase-like isoleucine patch superfamily enzyme